MKGKDGKDMKKMHHASKQHVGAKKGTKAHKKGKHAGKVDGHKAKGRMDKKSRTGITSDGYKSGGGVKESNTMWPSEVKPTKPMSMASKTEKDISGEKDVARKSGGRLTAAKRKK